MPTTNQAIDTNWAQVALDTDTNLLVTWKDPAQVECAATAANAAPAVNGHLFTREDAISRSLIGPGFVWVRALPPTPKLAIVVSK